jgi:hypothetical protein
LQPSSWSGSIADFWPYGSILRAGCDHLDSVRPQGGCAYLNKKIAEARFGRRPCGSLKRRISAAIYRRLRADAFVAAASSACHAPSRASGERRFDMVGSWMQVCRSSWSPVMGSSGFWLTRPLCQGAKDYSGDSAARVRCDGTSEANSLTPARSSASARSTVTRAARVELSYRNKRLTQQMTSALVGRLRDAFTLSSYRYFLR